MSASIPPSRRADQFVARFPDGLREQLAAVAKVNGRSMNAEIVARLQGSFDLITSLPLMVQDAVEDAAAAKGCTPEVALADLVLAGQASGGIVLNIRIAPGMTIKEVHDLMGAMMDKVPDAALVVVERE
ncbi:MAG: Arc family DNA-binding protein [Rhodoferax sp.]|uniref:Arc family DNA-binding protein n=1 Tax=Rhodoferax sp. TaxID=50421 RepID=UPI0027302024|nr:Arc family DNA-binding protein [Rhodoferax sp.]MDP1530327.1 Arc family DNA-binding protein [Rhodoferax sp.]MDP1943327.1 Arc family DNA-binding protein [Rhodoferax sp.]